MRRKDSYSIGLALGAVLFLSLPAGAQYFSPMTADPSLSFARDWQVTHPVQPQVHWDVPEYLSGPQLPFQKLSGDNTLTDEQHMALYGYERDCVNKVEPMAVELKSMQRDLRDLMTSPEIDKDKVMDLQTKIDAQRAKIADTCIQIKLNALSVLTPDQRKALKTIMTKDHSSFWHRLW